MPNQANIFEPLSYIDTAFWKFHRGNPQVFNQLVDMAFEAKKLGKKKIGMKMLFEVCRWEHLVKTKGDDFALNNSYTSRYVRIIEEQYPALVGLFEKRRIRT
jgi:hypothetical protein